jgi:hypothetical protein
MNRRDFLKFITGLFVTNLIPKQELPPDFIAVYYNGDNWIDDTDLVYVKTTNYIARTRNFTAASPSWEDVTVKCNNV